MEGFVTSIFIMVAGMFLLVGIYNVLHEAPSNIAKIASELKRFNDREEKKK